jgi:hypothetical protein
VHVSTEREKPVLCAGRPHRFRVPGGWTGCLGAILRSISADPRIQSREAANTTGTGEDGRMEPVETSMRPRLPVGSRSGYKSHAASCLPRQDAARRRWSCSPELCVPLPLVMARLSLSCSSLPRSTFPNLETVIPTMHHACGSTGPLQCVGGNWRLHRSSACAVSKRPQQQQQQCVVIM